MKIFTPSGCFSFYKMRTYIAEYSIYVIWKELRCTYKLASKNLLKYNNNTELQIFRELAIDTTEPYVPRKLQITLKDHKPNFLINPSD